MKKQTTHSKTQKEIISCLYFGVSEKMRDCYISQKKSVSELFRLATRSHSQLALSFHGLLYLNMVQQSRVPQMPTRRVKFVIFVRRIFVIRSALFLGCLKPASRLLCILPDLGVGQNVLLDCDARESLYSFDQFRHFLFTYFRKQVLCDRKCPYFSFRRSTNPFQTLFHHAPPSFVGRFGSGVLKVFFSHIRLPRPHPFCHVEQILSVPSTRCSIRSTLCDQDSHLCFDESVTSHG